MVVLTVVASVAVLLGLGCWWEARSGRPQWRDHRGQIDPAVRRSGARSASLSAVTTYGLVEGGGGDGS